jgi:acetylglutamate kinase
VLSLLHADSALDLIRSGTVEGGIVPKLLAAVRAARLGLIVEIGATAVVA